MAIDVRHASKGAMQAAAYSGELVHMITRGQFKMNMQILRSDDAMEALARITNRMALAIVAAGLFIGSSMYAQATGEGPFLGVSFIPFFGFLGAFVLSAWLIVDIRRRR